MKINSIDMDLPRTLKFISYINQSPSRSEKLNFSGAASKGEDLYLFLRKG